MTRDSVHVSSGGQSQLFLIVTKHLLHCNYEMLRKRVCRNNPSDVEPKRSGMPSSCGGETAMNLERERLARRSKENKELFM